jgi:hypothetical protein
MVRLDLIPTDRRQRHFRLVAFHRKGKKGLSFAYFYDFFLGFASELGRK